jgi:hypothetical protein
MTHIQIESDCVTYELFQCPKGKDGKKETPVQLFYVHKASTPKEMRVFSCNATSYFVISSSQCTRTLSNIENCKHIYKYEMKWVLHSNCHKFFVDEELKHFGIIIEVYRSQLPYSHFTYSKQQSVGRQNRQVRTFPLLT